MVVLGWEAAATIGAEIVPQALAQWSSDGYTSVCLGHYHALWSGERDVVDEAPARRREPVLDLRHAVDVAVAQVHGELARHVRRLYRLRVGGVGPEVGEQESRTGRRSGAEAAQQRGVARRRPVVHHVRHEDR